ncbi:MAG: hypothetical protein A3G18_05800 [Rhodospirillales bacterium RIFCSPLOWO2_12_FULL_58_28]|nr:MAG: hypothetical protein A3H92_00105 [Rhodospirillales bacterium RIFCSPLOWO2_02_FULL_58_16]OHC79297.1 MAG: hypothetical protein A3G18_05800 [Rhodospirillales bacterium RIFCSPLOWO2_12_FULL_58_28]
MNIPRFTSLLMAAVVLASCQDIQDNPKQAGGTLLGAGLGALAGSQIGDGKGQMAAIAIGALGGAWLGGSLGKSLDQADKMYAERTAQNTFEYNKSGVASSWNNPDSGHSGSFTPTRTFEDRGNTCRDYETTIYIGGKQETATGTACRQPNGSWNITR